MLNLYSNRNRMATTLYSIGHGHKTPEEFIKELQSFGIQYLIDVRSNPWSKWAPQFNQDSIANILKEHNIKYIYMGDTIGGKPADESCYDKEGYFDYEKMAAVPQFQQGLQRLVKANEEGYKVAVMCSETDPSQCHRSKLIGRELYVKSGIDMQHIVAPSQAIPEHQIITALTKGAWYPEGSLFAEYDTPPYFKSRLAHKQICAEPFYD